MVANQVGITSIPVTKVRNLGVIFDDKLSFIHHANAVVSSSFYALRMIKKLLPFLPPSTGRTLISTLVMSNVDYCNGLLINAQEKVLSKLQLVQNAAARILSSPPKFKPISKVVRQLQWLPIRSRIKFKVLCIAYKATHNTGPEFLKKALCSYTPIRPLCSSAANLLMVPRAKKASWGDRRFTVATAKLWNTLPLYIKTSSTLLAFRKQVKTWLFNQ